MLSYLSTQLQISLHYSRLLFSTLGRTGPGDSGWEHSILFDNNGPIAFHSAAHDAFGYLLNFHNTGPGYKYLGGYSVYGASEPLSDQVSGIEFWSDLLGRHKPKNRSRHIYWGCTGIKNYTGISTFMFTIVSKNQLLYFLQKH